MNFHDYYEDEYRLLLKKVLREGELRNDRTGVGTTAIFGASLKTDLRVGFPILSNKKMSIKVAKAELMWMLSGSQNIKFLQDNGIKIWNEWADELGDLGPVYGSQWRNFGSSGVDQVVQLIDGIKNNPTSRRHMVTSWNPTDLPAMKLPPCHYSFQCYVSNDGYLDLIFTMRSVDCFLGLPYDMALYGILMHLIGNVTGLKPRYLQLNSADTHIYSNHMDQVKEYLSRDTLIETDPQLVIADKANIDDYVMDDIKLINYTPQGAIKAPVAI